MFDESLHGKIVRMSSPATPLAWAHPLVRDWFVQRFGTAPAPQEQRWPHILAGRTTLISAPTGSGKTLAAFLPSIGERRAMLASPPHILVTTPESLYILLTAEKSREILRDVKTVIVDEIHAVADDKRGAHLALSLERLEFLTGSRPVRIGLSATQKPIEVVARFLSGADRPDPQIVQIGLRREMDLAIEVPRSELGPITTNEMWDEIYNRIAELATQHRSPLAFVN